MLQATYEQRIQEILTTNQTVQVSDQSTKILGLINEEQEEGKKNWHKKKKKK